MKGLIAKQCVYDRALGIKSVLSSPNGQYLAVGSFDQSARVFNSTSWNLITELKHSSLISPGSDVVCAALTVASLR